ncbi:MAG: tRNA lysidine(34) synthetase TilS [Opitutales bacterium]
MPDSLTDWPAVATRLSDLLSLERLERSVVSFLEDRANDPWVVACSGGADSTCLALVACSCFGQRSGPLVLAHFNHGLRGEDSDGDQGFVEDLAAGLGLAFEKGGSSDCPESPSEAVLRERRHAFLAAVCAKRGSDILLMGHHRDDLAETMLMRLTRGSGAEGLAAPRPLHRVRDIWRARPLLSLTRSELQNALRQAGAPWREDDSNADLGPFRNRVRLQVLPQLAEAAPNEALAGFGRSRDLLEEDAEALHDWAESSFSKLVDRDGALDAVALRALPIAVMRRVFRKWLSAGSVGETLSANTFDHLLFEIAAGRTCKSSVARHCWVVADELKVFLLEKSLPGRGWGPCALPAGGLLFLPETGVLRMEQPIGGNEARQALANLGVDERRQALLDQDSLEGPLTVRTWLPGDRYAPLGAPGSRKLQDLFTDRKVPPKNRERLPIVLSGDSQIAWCPGFPPAERHRVKSDSSTVLRLTYVNTVTI